MYMSKARLRAALIGFGSLVVLGTTAPATNALVPYEVRNGFDEITGVLGSSDGSLIVTDFSGRQVFEVGAAGERRLIAGSGQVGVSGDDGPAREAAMQTATVEPWRGGYVVEGEPHALRWVAPDGTLRRLLSSTPAGPLGQPRGVSADTFGGLVFADHLMIWRLSPTGSVTRLAGSFRHVGAPSLAVQPALEAELSPTDTLALPDGRIAFIDGDDIRVLGFDGLLRRVQQDNARQPVALALAPDGGLYVSERGLHTDTGRRTGPPTISHLRSDGTATVIAELPGDTARIATVPGGILAGADDRILLYPTGPTRTLAVRTPSVRRTSKGVRISLRTTRKARAVISVRRDGETVHRWRSRRVSPKTRVFNLRKSGLRRDDTVVVRVWVADREVVIERPLKPDDGRPCSCE